MSEILGVGTGVVAAACLFFSPTPDITTQDLAYLMQHLANRGGYYPNMDFNIDLSDPTVPDSVKKQFKPCPK